MFGNYQNKLFVILILAICFSCKSNKLIEKENYNTVETDLNDCNIYKMIFNDGKYMFRFALSGKCDNLSNEDYINNYKTFLDTYKDSLKVKNGMIIFEHYNTPKLNNNMIDSIEKITTEKLKRQVELKEKSEEKFVLIIN